MSKMNELKAQAYDLIAGIERAKMMLDQVNRQIEELSRKEQSPSEEVAKDDA